MNPTDSEIQLKIGRDVESVGWSWIWVFDPGEPAVPSFAYTIGLFRTFSHPEVVVVGLPESTSHAVLEAVFDSVESGARYASGSVSDEILNGFSVRFEDVSSVLAEENLVQAFVFNSGEVEVLQMVWPEKNGKFPGDDGAPSWLEERQKLHS
ncbi:DUF4262 domain-containing protein [Streptomyces sp. NBC_01571]|uniref:DUF4262 domain-containing protein n=1 Tax=Streptomyces sp. NBC_01571 TaxID=2975883 RepID=UPI002258283E|nr:DUF4262 domain-containing protein [Streptomyces sp. NBC_01571]MCX4578061.1 DUF4262 domain-containing protein [Streptomyces sp. NBC_01571]